MSGQQHKDDDQPAASADDREQAAAQRSEAAHLSTAGSSSAGPADGPRSDRSPWRGKKIGRFRLLSVLGRGSMGKVFLAEDTQLQRQVAIKVLHVARDHPARERKNRQFVREARAAAALEHPHVVNVLEIGEHRGLNYVAMDLVAGGDVRRMIETSGPLPVARACDLAADAAEGLAHAHEMGVIHRDVKPANLMVTRRGRVKLADFGLADPGDPNDAKRMRDGVIGTPSCMAPEVARGRRATPASDQYSLACTLWQMLTGEPLFTGDNGHHVLEKQARAVPPPLAEKVPGLPPTLADAVHRALAKDPADRFDSCEQLGRVLRSHAAALGGAGSGMGSTAASLSATGLPPVGPVPRRRRGRPVAIGLSLAVAVGSAAATWFFTKPQAPAAVAAAAPSEAATREPVLNTSRETAPAATASGPPAAGAAPAREVGASDTATLRALASTDAVVAVVGTVEEAKPSQSGKSMMVRFTGHRHGDFVVTWPRRDFAVMQAAFGGEGGDGLTGRSIRVTGEVSSLFGAPVIRLRDPAALEVLAE